MPIAPATASESSNSLRSDQRRHQLSWYPFHRQLQIRELEIDHQHHVNNVAVLAYFAELRSQFHRDLRSSTVAGEWDPTSLQPSNLVTEFVNSIRYPAPVVIACRVAGVSQSGYRLAAAIFQHGTCTSIQESVISCRRQGDWLPLPQPVIKALESHLVSGTAQ